MLKRGKATSFLPLPVPEQAFIWLRHLLLAHHNENNEIMRTSLRWRADVKINHCETKELSRSTSHFYTNLLPLLAVHSFYAFRLLSGVDMTPPRGTSGKSLNHEQCRVCLFGGDLTPRTQQPERCLTKDRSLLWLCAFVQMNPTGSFILSLQTQSWVECIRMYCYTATVSTSMFQTDPEYLEASTVSKCVFFVFFWQIG